MACQLISTYPALQLLQVSDQSAEPDDLGRQFVTR